MKHTWILSAILTLILAASCTPGVLAAEAASGSSVSLLECNLEIPLDKTRHPMPL